MARSLTHLARILLAAVIAAFALALTAHAQEQVYCVNAGTR